MVPVMTLHGVCNDITCGAFWLNYFKVDKERIDEENKKKTRNGRTEAEEA